MTSHNEKLKANDITFCLLFWYKKMTLHTESLTALANRIDPGVVSVEFSLSKRLGPAGWYMIYADQIKRPQYIGSGYSDAVNTLTPRIEPVSEVDAEGSRELNAELQSYEITEDQQHAVKQIIKTIRQRQGLMALKGFAGTGKTTVVQLAAHLASAERKRVAYTAPTNQAVKVLRQKMPGEVCMTIHSFLGLSVKRDRGKTKLVSSGKSQMAYFDAVCIDEGSMMGEQLMDEVYTAFTDAPRCSIIFIGDPKQLNPVGEGPSTCFDLENSVDLIDVIRQAEGNQILDATKRLRRMDAFSFDRLNYTENPNAPEGLFRLRMSEWETHIDSMFTLSNFSDNTDFVRILAWTNKKVKDLNTRIHRLLYGDTASPYVVGEKVLSKEPIADGIIKNGDECEVMKIEASQLHGFKCWEMILKTEYQQEVFCRVVDDSEFDDYEESLQELAAKEQWDTFYMILDSFAKMQHIYALTVHRSQGSTFDNVIIDVTDILRNSSPDELLRLLYVGVSRPRYRCWLK